MREGVKYSTLSAWGREVGSSSPGPPTVARTNLCRYEAKNAGELFSHFIKISTRGRQQDVATINRSICRKLRDKRRTVKELFTL